MLSLLDCFAGAGGSSWGAVETRKISVKMAINHDATAIATHQENLPSVNHDIADVFQVNPKRYPKTDLAWFSPCCEGFTHASGVKNTDTTAYQPELFDTLEYSLLSQKAKEEYRHKQILLAQKRLTVEEVYKFVETHRYLAFIVENVIELTRWKKYNSWLLSFQNIGYNYKEISLNSSVVQSSVRPNHQSRDRLFICFWQSQLKTPLLEISPAAFCPECDSTVAGKQTWKKGQRIGKLNFQYHYSCPNCLNPVNPHTRAVAEILDWSLPCPTIGSRVGTSKQLKPNTLERIKKGIEKFGNVPFLTELYGKSSARSINKPIGSITTSGAHHALVVPSPFLLYYYSRDNAIGSINKPVNAVTTCPRHALVIPPGFICQYNSKSIGQSIKEPLHAVTTKDRFALLATPQDIDKIGKLNEWGFRMLTPTELALAQNFPTQYKFLGNKAQILRQIGGAVPPGVAQIILTALAEIC
ncbi:DNA cytosine methyltransferase [Planktothrix sp. FACHB-1355]|uniref:DNA (cytosine-5-)-methyltransferase n=1 Tax=Aerosakkonema funiforme FACHB-1375 TaxID=2949571 RepID=A0A926VDM1_9CYAN|nr:MULTISPECIES: DNA cytosine methyltransferase [Oscillatoriales]MBD2180614.1 DNA cytosine methyltransferase [Aerosakkonema funiforme FACHB-1375]MBD3558311.1 DNA cytosine methyltransferase [Planktothrix sp. FACHB-1355]